MNKIDIHKDYLYNKNIINDITLIHISDIHFNSKTKIQKLNNIIKEIQLQKPNYIVITGDLIDSPKVTKEKEIINLLNFLKSLSKIAKTLIAIGNHDVFKEKDYQFFKEINKLDNIIVLDNKAYKDDYIYISGFTLPTSYYYNLDGKESIDTLLEHLNKHQNLLKKLPTYIPKVSLIHSPIRLPEEKILNILKEYDLLLSGHTHNGMVPKFLSKLFKKNQGIIAPRKGLFPKVARGKLEINMFNKTITIIINGGITKLGEKSANILSKLNFIYNIDINKIIITNKKGIKK